MQFPVLGLVDVLYQQHLDLANGVLDAAISLVGIYFSFALMPAMDAVLGTDLHPKTPVCKLASWSGLRARNSGTSAQTSGMVQAERKAASEDIRYRALLWTWVGLHCGLLLLCADAVHGHDMHPLACLGQHFTALVPSCYVLQIALSGLHRHQRVK